MTRSIGWLAVGLCFTGLLLTTPHGVAQDAAGVLSEADVEQLQSRRFGPRPDKTIFSPLELPTPNRIRTASGRPGEDYWQQQTDYQIEVSLDAELETLTAREVLTYTNNSPEALPYLWLTLEQNLFREDSEGSRFTPPGSRFNNRAGFNGGLNILSVQSNGRDVPLKIFDTLGRLDLPEPVAPRGGKVSVEIAWSFNIPEYGADRMGIRRVQQGKIFQLAQWFPAVCKFDDVNGWNTLPYLGQGEFYTEFGSYDVQITAPRGHIVCATGVLQNAQEVLTDAQFQRLCQAQVSPRTVIIRSAEEVASPEGFRAGSGPLTWHFRADKVRTFAWTSSDATIYDACAIDWGDGRTTLVQSVYPREARAWTESSQMLRYSILNYSKQWFPYPYPSATNVNGVCGGMEYPMIIFCGSDRNKRGLHGVTSHEIGHNWFPMVVNTDERRFPWMDEGFNTFINEYDRFDDYDHEVNGADAPAEPRRFSAAGMSRLMGRPTMQPLNLPADQIRPELLGLLAYNKTSVAMQMLREVVLGPERFDPAFREYIAAWAFKSPQPADFFRCMENGTGMDLDWFWRGWFIENLPLDQAVVAVRESARARRARIELANLREMVMPVHLQIDYDDGTSQTINLPVQVWYYTNYWEAEIATDGRSISRVTVDPLRQMPDLNRKNNVWTRPESASSEMPPASSGADSGDGRSREGGSGEGGSDGASAGSG